VRTIGVLAAGLVLSAAAPSRAGELAVEGHVGYFSMAATRSAEAVFGSAGGFTFGGAVRYDVWRGAFVSAGVRTFSKEGERVFLAGPGAPVQKLGFPLSLRLTPIQLLAGYRFRRGQLVAPYAGVGVAVTSYSETSQVAGESFDLDGTETGLLGVAGVELGRGRLRGGLELGYSAVSGVLGLGGVSQVYGEDDLGGLHVTGKLVLAFGTSPPKKPAPAKSAPKKP
jgi:opacity protein-like surface antigen